MKPYMAFSRDAGPAEGAILVIANTAKEARKLAYQSGECLNVEDWLDQSARLIKDNTIMALANQEKVANNEPHVIWSPVCCQACGHWGAGLTTDNLCGNCNEHPGDELLHRLFPSRPANNGMHATPTAAPLIEVDAA